MGAQLIVIEGPNIGMMFNLGKKTNVIGTDDSANIRLTDKEVAAKQAQIWQKREEFYIQNKDAKVQMRVNSVPETKATLTDGDTIEFGSTKLFFAFEPEAAADAPAKGGWFSRGGSSETKSESGSGPGAVAEESEAGGVQTRQRAFENNDQVLQSLVGGGGAADKATKRLKTILNVSEAVASILDLDKLQESLLEIVFEEFPCDRGAVLLKDDKTGEFEIKSQRLRDGEKHEPIKVSRTIINEAVTQKTAILTTDAGKDERFDGAMSILEQKIQSAMCAPITVKDKGKDEIRVIGVLQLDTTKQFKAFTKADLDLLTAVARQAGMAINNAMLADKAKEQEKLQHEVSIASSIQLNMLPKSVPNLPNVEIMGRMIPAAYVGGDYYDFIKKEGSDDLFVCVGDVSGKGVGAGLVMVMARSILKIQTKYSENTAEIIDVLNRQLCADTKPNIFMTMNVGLWKDEKKAFRYTGAGHEHLIIYRAKENKAEAILAGGIALGLIKKPPKPFEEHEIPLDEGDAIVLYSDGVTECMNEAKECLELERVVEIVNAHAAEPTEEMFENILKDVLAHQGKAEQHDDITLVILKRKKSG